jgi:hypothetical protein
VTPAAELEAGARADLLVGAGADAAGSVAAREADAAMPSSELAEAGPIVPPRRDGGVVHPLQPAHPLPPAPDCNPPYVLDAQGHRQYKPECP